MPNSEIKKLLKKYHQGTCTEDEQNRLFGLIESKSYVSDLEDSMRDIWDQTSSSSPLGFDKELMFDNISKQTEICNENRLSKSRYYMKAVSIAASILIVLSFSFLIVQHSYISDELFTSSVEKLREFKTSKGQFRTVSLPDGSVVKLNTSSNLKIGQTYSSDAERIVYLEGEAYFDVHRNEQKPFIVITKDIEVMVLGTSFNVNSNFNGLATKVAVASGKVKVENTNKTNQVFLEKNQMVTIAENQFLKLSGFDQLKEFGWVDKHLVFDEADFDQVVFQLENWYGVEILVSGSAESDGQWNYTAVFENQTLENVLLSMKFVKKFEYKINEKVVKMKF